MVSWGWIPICLIAGAIAGVFCFALVIANEEDRRDGKR